MVPRFIALDVVAAWCALEWALQVEAKVCQVGCGEEYDQRRGWQGLHRPLGLVVFIANDREGQLNPAMAYVPVEHQPILVDICGTRRLADDLDPADVFTECFRIVP